ncbi:hypothetical protein OAF54_01150 [bacterium]|nr:hypothetical protein [bacterium]
MNKQGRPKKPKSELRVRIGVYVPQDIADKILAESQGEDMSMSAVVAKRLKQAYNMPTKS